MLRKKEKKERNGGKEKQTTETVRIQCIRGLSEDITVLYIHLTDQILLNYEQLYPTSAWNYKHTPIQLRYFPIMLLSRI